ncbi:MAG: ABC transporter substrate-binding protein [Actinobacteria bacterium]|nr:ABC transporter substrate-binding protein [Actinomycetota bacterium]
MAVAGSVIAMSDEPRIVSLVPSITELLCDLGLAEQLVGRTGFCIHPWETVREIPKVGGTKDLRFDRIRELAPTHVVVNVDENRKEDAEALAEFVPHVVVTHPQEPRDNLALYRQMGREFDREADAEHLCERFQLGLSKIEPSPSQSVLYLIWRDPWMTVAPETYIAQTLALFNWRQPAGVADLCRPQGDKGQGVRYPEVDLTDFAGKVDRVLLSSEPFHFKEEHIPEVEALVPGAEVSIIDGEMTSWYGSRAIAGLDYLAEYTR